MADEKTTQAASKAAPKKTGAKASGEQVPDLDAHEAAVKKASEDLASTAYLKTDGQAQASIAVLRKIHKAMQEVQYLQKTGRNDFHKYNYVEAAHVVEKVREAMISHGLIFIPEADVVDVMEKVTKNGAIEYITRVQLTVLIMCAHTGEGITLSMPGQGQDAGDKGVYKAITGALKYLLTTLLMIPSGDDPEADRGVDERNAADAKEREEEAAAERKKLMAYGQAKAAGGTDELGAWWKGLSKDERLLVGNDGIKKLKEKAAAKDKEKAADKPSEPARDDIPPEYQE